MRNLLWNLIRHDVTPWPRSVPGHPWIPTSWKNAGIRAALALVLGVGVGLVVIIATYYIENFKLAIGVVGGVAYVLMTFRWPELSILSALAMLSGAISLTWLPLLPLGPVSLNISDFMLLLLLGLMFLRVTTQPTYAFYGSPLILPLLVFFIAILISAVNGILFNQVGFNTVLRTVRLLSLWILLIPTLQLIRDEQALRRLIDGILIFSGILLLGVVFPGKFEPFLPIEVRGAGTGSIAYSGATRIYFAGDIILYSMIPVTLATLAMVKKENQLWRIGFLCMLIFWALRTYFRQYWLTLSVVSLLMFMLISSQERLRLLRRMIPAFIAAVILAAALLVAQPARFMDAVSPLIDRVVSLTRNPFKREGSLHWRIIETRYALIQINRHPLLGIGLANRYRPPMESEAERMYSGWASKYIENGYLYIAVMMGMVGLIPFLWLCTVHLLRILTHYRKIPDDGLRAVYLGLGMAFLGMLACNLATPTFVSGTRLVFFPVSMAISEVILRLSLTSRA